MAIRPVATDVVSDHVQTTLFRALAVLRLVVLAYAVALNATRWHEFAHPVVGWVVVGGIVLWSAVVTWAYDEPRRRQPAWLAADLVVAMAALASTRFVEGAALVAGHAPTLPSFWVMAAVLAWAVRYGWVLGLGAAVVMSVVDVAGRSNGAGATWGNTFLLLLAAGIVGYAAGLVREATEARARAERVAAAMQERARLARVVHDGVLQVLALVQRRGLELGGAAADLGRLAGEQEVALRALVQGSSAQLPPADGDTDLGAALTGLSSLDVTVSVPGVPVPLPAPATQELLAVVTACLDNTARHAGPGARAWVLLEHERAEVTVTVRDDGPGIDPGRLELAESEGRLGVSASIRGRMADLGGSAILLTGPGQGTEWELHLPTG